MERPLKRRRSRRGASQFRDLPHICFIHYIYRFIFIYDNTSKMGRQTLCSALEALGKRATEPVSLVLGGNAALILGDTLQRPTDDGDVVTSESGFDQLGPLIRDVADAEHLPPGWLNGSIQSYTDILPPDYTTRLVTLPPFGRLHISPLSRRDVLLMKVYGMRPRDIEDLRALVPTTDELAFVATQVTRLAMKEPEKAQEMRDFLDEWAARG